MDEIQLNTEETLKEMNRKLRNKAFNYASAFNTDTGKAVIKDLKSMTALSHLTGNDMMDVNVNVNPSDLMFLREGQNQVTRYIEMMIKFYKENK